MQQSKCSSCGHPLPEGARWCPNCGNKVSKAMRQTAKTIVDDADSRKAKGRRKKQGWLKSTLTATLAAVLFVMAGISFFVIFGNDKENERGSRLHNQLSLPSGFPSDTDTTYLANAVDTASIPSVDDALKQMEDKRMKAEQQAKDARQQASERMENAQDASGTYTGLVHGKEAELSIEQKGSELHATYSSGTRQYAAKGKMYHEQQFELYIYNDNRSEARIRGIISGRWLSGIWEERLTGAVVEFKLSR